MRHNEGDNMRTSFSFVGWVMIVAVAAGGVLAGEVNASDAGAVVTNEVGPFVPPQTAGQMGYREEDMSGDFRDMYQSIAPPFMDVHWREVLVEFWALRRLTEGVQVSDEDDRKVAERMAFFASRVVEARIRERGQKIAEAQQAKVPGHAVQEMSDLRAALATVRARLQASTEEVQRLQSQLYAANLRIEDKNKQLVESAASSLRVAPQEPRIIERIVEREVLPKQPNYVRRLPRQRGGNHDARWELDQQNRALRESLKLDALNRIGSELEAQRMYEQ